MEEETPAQNGAGSSSKAETSLLNNYGFETKDGDYKEFVEGYLPVLERRKQRWEQFTSESEGPLPEGFMQQRKFKRFIRKGIPPAMRPDMWMTLSGAKKHMDDSPVEFCRLVSMECKENVMNSIELDLKRTYPDNEYFRTAPGSLQEDLKIVLTAFANKNPHIGYCQGLNYVAGMCLLIMKDNERAFWLIHSVIERLPDYYSNSMPGLRADMGVLNDLIAQELPDVFAVFSRVDFDPAMLVTKWFVCWYLETLPVETVLRVWDCFFHEGAKILFRCALTLIALNRTKFRACKNFGHVADVFKEILADSKVMQCHTFMKGLFELSGSMPSKTIDTFRKKHMKIVEDQDAAKR